MSLEQEYETWHKGHVSYFRFKEAKSVPDMLIFLSKIYPENPRYIYEFKLVMIKLNASKQKLLDEKYKPYIFESIEFVPYNIPTFALRNVYVYTCDSCDRICKEQRNYSQRFQKDCKNKKETLKYRQKTTEKRRHKSKGGYTRTKTPREYQKEHTLKKLNFRHEINQSVSDLY